MIVIAALRLPHLAGQFGEAGRARAVGAVDRCPQQPDGKTDGVAVGGSQVLDEPLVRRRGGLGHLEAAVDLFGRRDTLADHQRRHRGQRDIEAFQLQVGGVHAVSSVE